MVRNRAKRVLLKSNFPLSLWLMFHNCCFISDEVSINAEIINVACSLEVDHIVIFVKPYNDCSPGFLWNNWVMVVEFIPDMEWLWLQCCVTVDGSKFFNLFELNYGKKNKLLWCDVTDSVGYVLERFPTIDGACFHKIFIFLKILNGALKHFVEKFIQHHMARELANSLELIVYSSFPYFCVNFKGLWVYFDWFTITWTSKLRICPVYQFESSPYLLWYDHIIDILK